MYPQRSVMTCGLATALEPPHFNHAPVRGATPAPDLRIRGRVVSIHAPAWGATWSGGSSPRQTYCFNPRTRVGCDQHDGEQGQQVKRVSIHAPAWGATAEGRKKRRAQEIVSIHAPAWGATDQNASAWAAKFVSIHAPAWGATQGGPEQSGCGCSFNPRTRVGCDRPPCPWKIRPPQFQSTHPRGVRPSAGQVTQDCLPVSIHAPAWGATPPAPATPSPTRWFQSTHPRGVRRRIVAPAPSPHRFNPRTRVGCDFVGVENPALQGPVSIHAPAWGATPK